MMCRLSGRLVYPARPISQARGAGPTTLKDGENKELPSVAFLKLWKNPSITPALSGPHPQPAAYRPGVIIHRGGQWRVMSELCQPDRSVGEEEKGFHMRGGGQQAGLIDWLDDDLRIGAVVIEGNASLLM